MTTFGEIAAARKGQTTGFDYLRLGLALAVVASHCVSFDSRVAGPLLAHRSGLFTILPAFFALSGFLVTGSLFRNTLPEFIALRAIRLVPALAFETTLSALLLGPLFTTLPLRAYFSEPQFFSYFLNIIGDIHYFLPGVFDGERVNAQLWTLPFELKCYLVLISAALITLTSLKRFFALGMLLITIFATVVATVRPSGIGDWHPSGSTLVISFLWGCVMLLYRDRIAHSGWLAIGALLVAQIPLSAPGIEAFAALPVAYVTVYVGLMKLPAIRFGDLSYGIFLFHYPIMLALRATFGLDNVFALLAATVLLAGIWALISWNMVEHPVMQRKGAILAWLNRRIDRIKLARGNASGIGHVVSDGQAPSTSDALADRPV